MAQRSRADWKRTAARKMDASRRATLAFLSRLPTDEIIRPRTFGRWSVNDVLAHLAGWEAEAAQRLDLIARGLGHRVHWFHDMAGADRFNARAVARGRRRSPPATLRDLARVRRRLRRALRRVPAAALRDPYHQYPVVEWLPELAWTHEQEHLREFKAWWRRRRAAR
jgi:uncharacterized protein (TIGR03083 family)